MLSMNNISKVFHTSMVATHALRHFSLSIDEGEFVSITGPSGSGKSTFLNIAGLLENFDEGQYLLDGVDVTTMGDSALSRLRSEKIGFIFQDFNLIPDFTLYDNVEMPMRFRGVKASVRKQKIESALERVGLGSRMQHLPNQLSGGQQQRAAIARAIAGEPRILLADEPTGNLDSIMARQVMDLLAEIHQQGSTILMVTHDMELAQRSSRTINIIDGQVCGLSSIEAISADLVEA